MTTKTCAHVAVMTVALLGVPAMVAAVPASDADKGFVARVSQGGL